MEPSRRTRYGIWMIGRENKDDCKNIQRGIYCRLSNDDERDGESVSIENQKLLLQNYVRQRGWNEMIPISTMDIQVQILTVLGQAAD